MRSMKSIVAVLCVALLIIGSAFAAQHPRKFDEFGDIACEDEMAHLDNFAVQLQREPKMIGYIMVYGGQMRKRGDPKARASRMKDYLTRNRGIDAKRVVTILSGYLEQVTVDLWILPPDIGAPQANPFIQQKNVKFAPGRISKDQYHHCGGMY